MSLFYTCLFNPHQFKILLGPDEALIQAWQMYHTVVWHIATQSGPSNAEYHNFQNPYYCNDSEEDTATAPLPGFLNLHRTRWTHAINPKEVLGGSICLELAQPH